MSSTRKAQPGSEFRQERFASSPEFQRGLMANLVARRCKLLRNREDRDLIWFLQFLSHKPGGLDQVVEELLKMFPERNTTPSMRKFGIKPHQIYSAAQVIATRGEIPGAAFKFPLSGEISDMRAFLLRDDLSDVDDPYGDRRREAESVLEKAEREARLHPSEYPAEAFCAYCWQEARRDLPRYLADLCLDPGIDLGAVDKWYFMNLAQSLREYQARWIEDRRRGAVITEVGGKVFDTIEYAMEGRCLTIINGTERIGKTHAAKAWCEFNPGRARYIEVPSSNDDIGFFRAIAESLGVSINLNSKAQELRQRIEETVKAGDLVLVFDEAHYLWPNGNYRLALPSRLNWIMTALVNAQVPVALVTTPQFFQGQKAVEQRTYWTSGQFLGRIGHYEPLPSGLSEKDLLAVARVMLPGGDSKSIEILVRYAQTSAKYLAAIETAARRARYLAKREGRQDTLRADVKRAIREGVIPSDTALVKAIEGASHSKRRHRTASAPPVSTAPALEIPTPTRASGPQLAKLETDRNRQTGLVPVC